MGSIALAIKSLNCISTIGLAPVIAAPTPSPAIASSDIGVSFILSSPYFSNKPSVTPKAPPYIPISSPAKKASS